MGALADWVDALNKTNPARFHTLPKPMQDEAISRAMEAAYQEEQQKQWASYCDRMAIETGTDGIVLFFPDGPAEYRDAGALDPVESLVACIEFIDPETVDYETTVANLYNDGWTYNPDHAAPIGPIAYG